MNVAEVGCKLPKPLVEKRRRARFNKSLEELKHLVPEMAHGAIRMDKADILELTVSHLKALQDECVQETDTDPSYKDGFKRCIEETANVVLSTAVPEEVKRHFITQLKLLSLGQDTYSPLTPEYERNELCSSPAKCMNFNMSRDISHPPALFPNQHLSPLSTFSTSPNTINHSSTSPFERQNTDSAARSSAFNTVDSSRTLIKREIHSPDSSASAPKTNAIWRPWS